MAATQATIRSIRSGWAILLLAAWGCGSTNAARTVGGSANSTGDPSQQDGQADDDPGAGQTQFTAANDGGGDLAVYLGGTTYSGEATGTLASGTLTLTFSDDGVLTSMGGTVLGSFFGFPEGTEVVFDFLTPQVTGTYQAAGVAPRPLEDYLAESENSLAVTSVAVNLVSQSSFFVATGYYASVGGLAQGEDTIILEATLRTQTDRNLDGGLILPGYLEAQVPVFTLVTQ